jgi:capsular exopolysaccharide synthesis family protein
MRRLALVKVVAERGVNTVVDVQRVLNLLRRWWPALVVGTLLAAGASYAVSKAQPKVYQATVVLKVNPGLDTSTGTPDFNGIQAAATLATADAQLLPTTSVAQGAIDSVGKRLVHLISAETLVKNTKASATPQSFLVDVTVHASDPSDAALLAQAMADNFVANDAASRAGNLNTTLQNVLRDINLVSTDYTRANHEYTQLTLQPTLTLRQVARSSYLSQHIAYDQTQLDSLRTLLANVQLQKESPGATTSVVDAAQASPTPISPRTTVNVVVAAVLMLLALLGIAVLTDALDARPRSAAEVAAALDLPLAGTISSPHSLAHGGVALAALQDPASLAADEYRLLRTTLGLGTDPDYPATPRVLAITGTAADSGATTVAANLAAVTARTGARVIVVDADLRHPTLHTFFGLPDGAGLSTALRDGDDSTALLQVTAVPGLQVLTTGPTTTAAVAIDLLDSTRMQTVLAELRAMADLVVVNTSAAMLPDTAALTRLADGTLLVARLHSWNKTTLTVAADRLRLAGARLEGVVVTRFVGAANRGLRLPVPTPGVVEREQSAPAVTEREQSARTSPRPAK